MNRKKRNNSKRNLYFWMTIMAFALALWLSPALKVWADADVPSPGELEGEVICTGMCPPDDDIDPSPTDPPSDGGSDGGESDNVYVDGKPWCNPLGGSPEEQAEAGAGGLVYGGDVCAWTCGGMTIAFSYDEGSGEWNLTASNLDTASSNDFEYPSGGDNSDWFDDVIENGLENAGLPTCGEWSSSTRAAVENICWDELIIAGRDGGDGSGLELTCGGNYSVSATAYVPCPTVQRWPYPRGIVNSPIEFTVQVSGTSSSDDSREWCEPEIANYEITVGWDQVPVLPRWNWDERSWASQPEESYGFQVYHTYDTASYEKPENGPNLRGGMDYPAYQVTVETLWQPWIRDDWDQWTRYSWDCHQEVVGQVWNSSSGEYEDDWDWQGTECTERVECQGQAPAAFPNSSECGEWRHRSSGKIVINLLEFGFSEPYARRIGGSDITTPPPEFTYNLPRACSIPVPVIESQGLLTIPEVP